MPAATFRRHSTTSGASDLRIECSHFRGEGRQNVLYHTQLAIGLLLTRCYHRITFFRREYACSEKVQYVLHRTERALQVMYDAVQKDVLFLNLLQCPSMGKADFTALLEDLLPIVKYLFRV